MTEHDLISALETFRIFCTVQNIQDGPIVTVYEIQPVRGTRVKDILALTQDLELALGISKIQIQMSVNKPTVQISIPKETRAKVMLPELLRSKEFGESKAKLALGLGKDQLGKPLIVDLSECPHLLIAGQTGGGKSVLIHNIICSILLKHTPQQTKLALIDPKGTEFNIYDGLPHLIDGGTHTSVGKAAVLLDQLVREMEDRNTKFAAERCRNIDEYRAKGKAMHRIVVIVDEMADLMLQGKKSIELPLIRLAQMSRAAGIHLVVATQRPTVNIITGLIKANFPSRIALRVRSNIDSRVILDQGGAEKLLGQGDMLVLTGLDPIRAQAAFVSNQEIQNFCGWVKSKHPTPPPTPTKPAASKFDEDQFDQEEERYKKQLIQMKIPVTQERLDNYMTSRGYDVETKTHRIYTDPKYRGR